jgi:hypothetical protein
MYVVVFVGIGMAMVYILFELIHRLRNIKILISEFHLGFRPDLSFPRHFIILFYFILFFMRCITFAIYSYTIWGIGSLNMREGAWVVRLP